MKIKSVTEISLPPADTQRLRDQPFDADHPGPIVRDFETLLAFIGARRLPASPTNQLLPVKALADLNAQLSRPVHPELKRPMQKSYPYIHGLYLLLRASALLRVEGAGAKTVLALNDDVLASWQRLNATEKYFTLLESWLLRSTPEMIGESRSYLSSGAEALRLITRMEGGRLRVAGNRREEERLPFIPGLHNVALLDLFGIATVRQGESQPGKGWRVIEVRATPFGQSLVNLLLSLLQTEDLWMVGLDGSVQTFGDLQPGLQLYFPEWRNNLSLPAAEFRDGTYVFKVALGKIWRRLALPGKLSLDDLSAAILNAFHFDDDHLYRFSYKNRFGTITEVNHPYLEESPYTTEVRLGDLPLEEGGRMTYLFDFGDHWEFDVMLERINAVDTRIRKPRLLETHGKAPEQYPGFDDDGDDEDDEEDEG